MIYKNFTLYTPESAVSGVTYLQSEDGQDWYDVRDSLSVAKLKIAYQDDGVIRMQSYNAVELYPENLSVAEIGKRDVPKNFPERLDGNWIFDGKKIVPRVITAQEVIDQAEEKRAELMGIANQKIAPLQDAVDLDMATNEERALLTGWKKYRVELNRIDTNAAPDIDWPEVPDVA
ncbi:tail fiber assembly protein [Hafnia paralvei]|uniref:tail fiber assembly protein n=1 Tax=Hafnia paralvei TaxID=546367 RepID=UPI003751B9C9